MVDKKKGTAGARDGKLRLQDEENPTSLQAPIAKQNPVIPLYRPYEKKTVHVIGKKNGFGAQISQPNAQHPLERNSIIPPHTMFVSPPAAALARSFSKISPRWMKGHERSVLNRS